jgi:acetamidase/formamidase
MILEERNMTRSRSFLAVWALVSNLGLAAGQQVQVNHRLLPTPQTITWGYFDARTPPVLRIRSGDIVEMESLIAFTVEGLEAAGLSRDKIQPALLMIDREVKERGEVPHILTGPIWVDGAEPGDVLEVKVIAVEPTVPYAVNFFGPDRGFLPDVFTYEHYKITPLDLSRQVAKFSKSIEIPIKPFFGVMGVAPSAFSGRISSGPPGIHTGNMDNKELVAGSTVYLPVHVKGALFSAGDGHAAQGDGEICVTALETSLRGTFQFSVRKGQRLLWPRAETPTHFVTMGFHENLEVATRIAVVEMMDFLVKEKGLSREDAYILASDAVDLRITQLVDGKKGVHALLPKGVFAR